MRFFPWLIIAVLATELGAADAGPARTIYVTDFEVDPGSMKQEPDELLAREAAAASGQDEEDDDGPVRKRLKKVRERVEGNQPGPEGDAEQAEKLVKLMSKTLVGELTEKGYTVEYLAPEDPRPRIGWLVRGVFTQIDEGQRLKRAMIGFGAGETEIQAYATLSDIYSNADSAPYRIDAEGQVGKVPGAVITLNPYVAAAKFVMSRNDLEKSVKRAAKEIADGIDQKLEAGKAKDAGAGGGNGNKKKVSRF